MVVDLGEMLEVPPPVRDVVYVGVPNDASIVRNGAILTVIPRMCFLSIFAPILKKNEKGLPYKGKIPRVQGVAGTTMPIGLDVGRRS